MLANPDRAVAGAHQRDLRGDGQPHSRKSGSECVAVEDDATRAYLAAGIDRIPDCNVTFDGKLQLTGLSIERTQETLAVKYRWRCLQPVDRDYWCFTHIVDGQGAVAGYLDHPILNGEPPTSRWKEGDVVIERLLFRFSKLQPPYRLRLGLFHRESGERLRVNASGFPLTDGGTAAIVSEGTGRETAP